jgi:hypothetical protein
MWHAWERRENCTGYWWESPKERDHSEDRGIDGRLGFERILGKFTGGVDPVGSGQGPEAGPCEYGDEPEGSGATDLLRQ